MPTLSRFISVCVLFGALSCRPNEEVAEGIASAVDQGPGTRLKLADNTDFEWDKVCIFGPYTEDARIDTVTGISGAAKRAHDIRSNDGINVVMFIDNDRIVRAVSVRRDLGDFGPELVSRCYLKDEAVFFVRKPLKDSWGNIGP